MREIPLTKGYIAIVDDEDYKLLMPFKWQAAVRKNGCVYASRDIVSVDGKSKKLLMHRVIMNATEGKFVDHRNGDTLDNQKCNLRLCTKSQNGMNRGKQRNNTSGYCGVFEQRGSFMARVKIDGENKYLGTYPTAIEAAYAYDIAAEKYHGEFAKLNFPRQNPESTYLCIHEIRTITDPKPDVDQSGSAKTDPVCFDCQWDGTFKRC